MIGNVLIGARNVMPPLTTNRLLARLTFGYYLQFEEFFTLVRGVLVP